ncbi:MAG: restriction endonuclease [Nanoarchaeota archaeon]
MKNKAAKGAMFERELLHFLNAKGFSVMRAPSSGGYLYPVDVLAIKKGKILAFECKNYKTKPKLNPKQLSSFKKWAEKAGAISFLAWRTPKNEWKFLRVEDAENKKYEDENWFEMPMLEKCFMF